MNEPQSETKRSRLAAIRKCVTLFANECESGSTDTPCSVVDDMAALLAVVDSTLSGNTPAYEADVAQATGELFGEGTKARAKYEERAAAWRRLA